MQTFTLRFTRKNICHKKRRKKNDKQSKIIRRKIYKFIDIFLQTCEKQENCCYKSSDAGEESKSKTYFGLLKDGDERKKLNYYLGLSRMTMKRKMMKIICEN